MSRHFGSGETSSALVAQPLSVNKAPSRIAVVVESSADVASAVVAPVGHKSQPKSMVLERQSFVADSLESASIAVAMRTIDEQPECRRTQEWKSIRAL